MHAGPVFAAGTCAACDRAHDRLPAGDEVVQGEHVRDVHVRYLHLRQDRCVAASRRGQGDAAVGASDLERRGGSKDGIRAAHRGRSPRANHLAREVVGGNCACRCCGGTAGRDESGRDHGSRHEHPDGATCRQVGICPGPADDFDNVQTILQLASLRSGPATDRRAGDRPPSVSQGGPATVSAVRPPAVGQVRGFATPPRGGCALSVRVGIPGAGIRFVAAGNRHDCLMVRRGVVRVTAGDVLTGCPGLWLRPRYAWIAASSPTPMHTSATPILWSGERRSPRKKYAPTAVSALNCVASTAVTATSARAPSTYIQ